MINVPIQWKRLCMLNILTFESYMGRISWNVFHQLYIINELCKKDDVQSQHAYLILSMQLAIVCVLQSTRVIF